MYNKIGYIIILFFLLNSCAETPYNSGDRDIQNLSVQEINLKIFNSGYISYDFTLKIGEVKSFPFGATRTSGTPPPFVGDSVIVSYNDTTLITHYRIGGGNIFKNIFNKDSWLGGQIDDYIYKYEYVFTDVDYEEALSY